MIIHLPFDPAFAGEVPYPILAVELEEGARLFGRYRGDVDAISAGLPVRAVIYYVGEQPMLGFEAAK